MHGKSLIWAVAEDAGYLWKLGRNNKWEQRWMVLCGTNIFYFKNEKVAKSAGGEPNGVIPLEGATLAYDKRHKTQPYAFNVNPPVQGTGGPLARPYVLAARDRDELDQWLSTIQIAIMPVDTMRNLLRTSNTTTPEGEMFVYGVNLAGELQNIVRRTAPLAAKTAKLRGEAEHKEDVLAEMQLQAQQWQDYLVDSLKHIDQDVGPITSHLLNKEISAALEFASWCVDSHMFMQDLEIDIDNIVSTEFSPVLTNSQADINEQLQSILARVKISSANKEKFLTVYELIQRLDMEGVEGSESMPNDAELQVLKDTFLDGLCGWIWKHAAAGEHAVSTQDSAISHSAASSTQFLL